MWVESCTAQGTDPLVMNLDTLLEYRDDVRLELDGVSGKTWNRQISSRCDGSLTRQPLRD